MKYNKGERERYQMRSARCRSVTRLDGKTAIITGANTGIGKETARELSKRGGRIILSCRDLKKAEEAATEIRTETGGEIIVRHLDLASLESVRAFAETTLIEDAKIHVLINNAGVMMCPKWKTKDGFEMHFGVNHLGHFLLTNLLLDRIKESAPARIINVASLAHRGGKIHFGNINLDRGYSPTKAYCQSKLANIMFTKELATRLEGSGVTAYSLHPGVVNTELGRHLGRTIFPGIDRAFHVFSKLFCKSAVAGSQTTLHCALDEKAGEETGLYYSECKVASPSGRAVNKLKAERLWALSEELVGLNTTKNG